MKRLATSLIAAGALALAAGPAVALDLTYQDVVVQGLDDYGFTDASTPGNVLHFNGGTDELYQMFGYIGTAGDGFRIDGTNFTTTGITQTGVNTMQSDIMLSAAGATALGFGPAVGPATTSLDVTYGYRLMDGTGPGVGGDEWLEWTVSFTNNTASVMNFEFYAYLDLDINGTFANDTAFMNVGVTNAMVVEEGATNFIWNGFDRAPDRWQIGTYPAIRNTLDTMTSAVNLTNNPALGSTFGPADFTGAFQYSLTVNPGQTISLRSAVPEPGTTLLMLAGLIGLSLFPRAARRA